MNTSKGKKNRIGDSLKYSVTEEKNVGSMRSSSGESGRNLRVEADREDLPPRIRRLISAAVRVWELKRGIHVTSLSTTRRPKARPLTGHRHFSTV